MGLHAMKARFEAIFRGLIAILAIALIQPASTPDAHAQAREWGVLAEMAGRDFEVEGFERLHGSSFRWEGNNLVERSFDPGYMPLGDMLVSTYSRDPASGIISIRREVVGAANALFNKYSTNARIAQDGSVIGTGQLLYELRRKDNDQFQLTIYNAKTTRNYRPIAQASLKLRDTLTRRVANGFPAAVSGPPAAVSVPEGMESQVAAAPSVTFQGSVSTNDLGPKSSQSGTSQWGILAELAGHDFELQTRNSPEMGSSFRWEGQNIVERQFETSHPLTDWTRTYSRDAASGVITVRIKTAGWGTVTKTAQAAADGTLLGPDFEMRRTSGGVYESLINYGFLRGRFRSIYRPPEQGTPRVRDAIARRLASGASPAVSQPISIAGAASAAALQPSVALPAVTADQIGVNANSIGPRIALVVGVSNYGTLGNLTNPVNDAQALAASLRSLGFDVDLVVDPNQRGLREAISKLGERMGRAGRGATGLFFFAGHGIQSRGVNYLLPSGALINREADLALEAIPADTVLLQMQEAGVSTNIIILDACRNTPFTRSFRNAGRGLAQMDAPNGTFIAYSTAPGSVAADGAGLNSPFVSAMLQEIVQPSQSIEAVFRNVRRSVLRATDGLQTPWDSSSMTEPFYFRQQ